MAENTDKLNFLIFSVYCLLISNNVQLLSLLTKNTFSISTCSNKFYFRVQERQKTDMKNTLKPMTYFAICLGAGTKTIKIHTNSKNIRLLLGIVVVHIP